MVAIGATELSVSGGVPAIIELRRYRLHLGTRETLIDLFDREFVETQEALGMKVLGQFRDIDDPDAFAWLRGFTDMRARAEALEEFYNGPVWATHGPAANATMINSDNVLLLRPLSAAALGGSSKRRAASEPAAIPTSLVLCTVAHLKPNSELEFAEFFEEAARPILAAAGAPVTATLVTERSPNSFPPLPVREGETVFVWISSFPDLGHYATHMGRLAQSRDWREIVLPETERRTWRENDEFRLVPTARSLLR